MNRTEISGLERSRSNWRALGIGLAGVLCGFFMAGTFGAGAAPSEVASVVIDTKTSSGRWGSTLIAIMENGDIMYLDTKRPRSEWLTYKYNPSFKE